MGWSVKVDWDRNNDFTGTYDDISEYVELMDWQVGMRPFMSMADENTANIYVRNDDRRFSPEYPSSPLNGNLIPNTPVQIAIDDTPMYTGFIRTVKPSPMEFKNRVAVIECVGVKERLDRAEIYTDLYENVTADEVILDIIQLYAIPPSTAGAWLLGIAGASELGINTYLSQASDLANLDVGLTTFAYVGDNFQGDTKVSAYEIIRQLVEGERGRFFIGRDGRANFWNRHHLLNDFTIDLTLDNEYENIQYATPYEDLINAIEVTVYPRTESATSDDLVHQLEQPVTVQPNESVELLLPYRDEQGRFVSTKNIQTPAGGDLVISSGGVVSVEGQGQRAKVTVQNPTANAITLSSLKLRGKKVSSYYPVTMSARDTNSIAMYGRKPMQLDLKALDDPAQALDVANFELIRRGSIKGRIDSVDVWDIVTDESHDQIATGIGDLIRVVDDQLYHDQEYHIIGELYQFDGKSKRLDTTWLLEPASDTVFWALGVEGKSEIGVTTYLSY